MYFEKKTIFGASLQVYRTPLNKMTNIRWSANNRRRKIGIISAVLVWISFRLRERMVSKGCKPGQCPSKRGGADSMQFFIQKYSQLKKGSVLDCYQKDVCFINNVVIYLNLLFLFIVFTYF